MKRHCRSIFFALLIFALALPLSGAQSAKPSVEYAGLTHTALGGATLAVVDERLIVSNIGPGGLEGVLIDLGIARRVRTVWQDFSAEANFATLLQVVTLGTLAGHAAESTIGSLFVAPIERDLPTPGLAIEVNFNAIRAHSYTFEIYDDGTLVGSQTGDFVFTVASPTSPASQAWPIALTQLGGGAEPTGYILEWGTASENLTFTFPHRDNVRIAGDELRVYAKEAIAVSDLTGSELRVGDLSSLTILGEDVESLP